MKIDAVIVYIGSPMRLPSRSFGVLTNLRLTTMKPCRKERDGKTGMATNGQEPAENREMNSELEYSQASNSSPPDMRSKISRGESMLMKFRSTPSTGTAPVASATARSYNPQANVIGTFDKDVSRFVFSTGAWPQGSTAPEEPEEESDR